MAMDTIDHRDLESWEDAFKQPIPVVRIVEKKLRNSIHENQEKLRLLVGASYRDLLATARTIVEINGQVQTVENSLTDLGNRCNPVVVERTVTNFTKYKSHFESTGSTRRALACQIRVLQKCLAILPGLLKGRASILLVAKVLVLARLVYKALLPSVQDAPVIQNFGRRLIAFREKLLRYIDQRLLEPDNENNITTEILTAYSLATSSTPSNVLRHFQTLRLNVIRKSFENQAESVEKHSLRRLYLLADTVKVTRSTFPDSLGASLKSLGARALLQDEKILGIEELSLDIYGFQLPENVRNFTPFTQHDELHKAQVQSSNLSWIEKSVEVVVAGVREDLDHITSLTATLHMRKDVLQSWLSLRSSAANVDQSDLLSKLRRLFLQHIEKIAIADLSTWTEAVPRVLQELLQADSTENQGDSDISLWSEKMLYMEISYGAKTFKDAIADRRRGRNDGIRKIVNLCGELLVQWQQAKKEIDAMQEMRWDYEVEDDFNNDDLEADPENSVADQLSKEDPKQLQLRLTHLTRNALARLEELISHQITSESSDCSSPGSSGVLLIRVLGELRGIAGQMTAAEDPAETQQSFCQEQSEQLQNGLIQSIRKGASQRSSAPSQLLNSNSDMYTSLWDGSPALPVQPSSAAFKYLRAITKHMESFGHDLWVPEVVRSLRLGLLEDVSRTIFDAVESENVDDLPEDDEEAKNDETAKDDEIAKDETDVLADDHSSEVLEARVNAKEAETEVAEEERLADEQNSHETTSAVETVPSTEGVSVKRHRSIQLAFDCLYLGAALQASWHKREISRRDSERPNMASVLERLLDKSSMEPTDRARLRKSASECWRRTYLLFGLLAD